VSDKTKRRARGLRDIGTLQMIVHSMKPLERQQLVGRFSRLDSDRTRLERELVMWTTRKTATEAKLAVVYAQIEELKPLLLDAEGPVKTSVKPRARGQGHAPASTEAVGSVAPRHRPMSLEY